MVAQGVIRSLRLTTAKSCMRGAPNMAAPLRTADTPGTVLTSTPGYFNASSSIRPLMP